MPKALLGALLSLLSVAGLPGQAKTPSGTNPAVVPTEPEIVMPQVILQIEDLSVEKVEAQLPPEEDLLPPERKIPVLSEGDLAIGEPSIPSAGLDAEASVVQAHDRYLSSDIVLGAGSQNRILGSISLKTLGQDPRFSLLFNHETLDGFFGHRSGAGYNLRNDILDGSLKFRLGGVDTDIGGSFSENETGLQGQSPFAARLGRILNGTAAFSGIPLDWLTLSARVEGGADSLTLKSDDPQRREGVRVVPSLAAEARFGAAKVGLEARYAFRVDPATDQSEGGALHRFQATASFGVDLPATFILEGSAGWYWNSASLSLFPFALTLTGTPFEFITFALGGGYKVTPYDMHDLLSLHPLVLPNSIEDDRGWFGEASFQLTLARDFSATVKLSFMASEAMPTGAETPYSGAVGTGLFPVTQGEGMRLSSTAGFRWGITQAFSISAGWTHEYLDRIFFAPIDSLKAELLALDSTGRFGGNLSIAVAPTFTGILQQPVVRLSGFWKITDAVKLQVDGDDLLGLLPGDSRWDMPPYVSPGARVTGSLSISL
jgi:hypothetical protein